MLLMCDANRRKVYGVNPCPLNIYDSNDVLFVTRWINSYFIVYYSSLLHS